MKKHLKAKKLGVIFNFCCTNVHSFSCDEASKMFQHMSRCLPQAEQRVIPISVSSLANFQERVSEKKRTHTNEICALRQELINCCSIVHVLDNLMVYENCE
jgi:predicted nucleic acid-binding protein